MDTDDSYMLLSPHGAASFPASLTVRHDFGEMLLSSYRTDSADEGIVIHRRLRFGSDAGPYLCEKDGGVTLHGCFERTLPDSGTVERTALATTLRYLFSAADTAEDDAPKGVLSIGTDTAAVLFDVPVRSVASSKIAGPPPALRTASYTYPTGSSSRPQRTGSCTTATPI